MKQLLKELVETPGVSGREDRIRTVIREKVEEHADNVEEDDFGNLIVRKGSGNKTLLIDAHMDQIGLSVNRITEEGFIKVGKIGGIFPENVLNQKMKIHASEGETVKGVLGQKPPHLLREEEGEPEIPDMEDIFLDVGAEDEEDARDMGIRVGDRISFEEQFSELANNMVTSPALDDRAGCTVAIEALKRFDQDYELAVVFAVQEEVGTKGAKTASFRVDPDVALAIDVGIAGDTPGIEPDEADAEIGEGVGIELVQGGGKGLLTPEKIENWLIETAEENDIDYYREIVKGGATDAMSIELTREGVPTGSLSLPLRYMHSSVEAINLSDLEEVVDLVEESFDSMEDYF